MIILTHLDYIANVKKTCYIIGCLDDAVVPNQDCYWFGPSVWTNNFVSVQTFGSVILGPPQHQGPRPIQLVLILVRYKFSV